MKSFLAAFISGYRIFHGKTFLGRWWPGLLNLAIIAAFFVLVAIRLMESSRAVDACERIGSVAIRTVDGEFICTRGRAPW